MYPPRESRKFFIAIDIITQSDCRATVSQTPLENILYKGGRSRILCNILRIKSRIDGKKYRNLYVGNDRCTWEKKITHGGQLRSNSQLLIFFFFLTNDYYKIVPNLGILFSLQLYPHRNYNVSINCVIGTQLLLITWSATESLTAKE